ncbi:P-loop containing nucleoside triphosphate hydrolase protein [Exophiala viscosa]|uniref:P-loop containing nucleoside triphosphate hydrolase protein n=1 Tax=Exophiala viscosa TaxID=2486360 RepID=UPI00218E4A7C|nr:P-loop containing nucleoside triphosphate hydrolase protein [Exophiala viscosa]
MGYHSWTFTALVDELRYVRSIKIPRNATKDDLVSLLRHNDEQRHKFQAMKNETTPRVKQPAPISSKSYNECPPMLLCLAALTVGLVAIQIFMKFIYSYVCTLPWLPIPDALADTWLYSEVLLDIVMAGAIVLVTMYWGSWYLGLWFNFLSVSAYPNLLLPSFSITKSYLRGALRPLKVTKYPTMVLRLLRLNALITACTQDLQSQYCDILQQDTSLSLALVDSCQHQEEVSPTLEMATVHPQARTECDEGVLGTTALEKQQQHTGQPHTIRQQYQGQIEQVGQHTNDDLRTLVHEGQNAIQDIQGFYESQIVELKQACDAHVTEIELLKAMLGDSEQQKAIQLEVHKSAALRSRALCEAVVKRLVRVRQRSWVLARFFAPANVDPKSANVKIAHDDPSAIEIHSENNRVEKLPGFLSVLPAVATNADIWHSVRPLLISLLDPSLQPEYLVTIVDGQTGSGKSFTMFDRDDSVMPLTAAELFVHLNQEGCNFTVECAAAEVYRGKVEDQFRREAQERRKDVKRWEDLQYRNCTSAKELTQNLRYAHQNLHRSVTGRNCRSSRGHFCVIIRILSHESKSGARRPKGVYSRSIVLVDLAGAEKEENGAWETESLRVERQAINRDRTDFHTWLEGRCDGHFSRPTRALGTFLWPALADEERCLLAYICCLRLADASDVDAQHWAEEDARRAGKVASTWLRREVK